MLVDFPGGSWHEWPPLWLASWNKVNGCFTVDGVLDRTSDRQTIRPWPATSMGIPMHTPWWWVQACIVDYLALLIAGLPKLSFKWRRMISDSSNSSKRFSTDQRLKVHIVNPSTTVDLQQLECRSWGIKPPKWKMFDTYQYTMVALCNISPCVCFRFGVCQAAVWAPFCGLNNPKTWNRRLVFVDMICLAYHVWPWGCL